MSGVPLFSNTNIIDIFPDPSVTALSCNLSGFLSTHYTKPSTFLNLSLKTSKAVFMQARIVALIKGFFRDEVRLRPTPASVE